jgi:hypothetical protein
MILCCGSGIGLKFYKCYQRDQRRTRVQQEMNDLIDMHKKLLQRSTADPLNKTNLLMNETDVRKV